MKYKKVHLLLAYLLLISLIACNNKNEVEHSPTNHLTYLGLKGKIKEIDLSLYEHEITDNDYVPKGKVQNNYLTGCGTRELDLIFNIQNKIYKSSDGIFLDPYNIALDKIFGMNNRATNFKMNFNEKGYITGFKGFDNDILVLDNKFYYDEYNRINKFEKNINFRNEKVYFTYKYIYNKNNLIKSKSIYYKDELKQQYNYKYEKSEGTLKVQETLSGNENKKYTYSIDLNKENQISYIENITNKKNISFENFEITNYKELFEDGKISTNNEFHYFNNKVDEMVLTMRVRNSDRYNHSSFKFNYNKKGNIKAFDYNGEDSGIVFEYEYDNLNWKKMSYSRNRRNYDYYNSKKKQIEEQIKLNKRYYNLSELLDVNTNLSLIKNLSSKIVIERKLKYY